MKRLLYSLFATLMLVACTDSGSSDGGSTKPGNNPTTPPEITLNVTSSNFTTEGGSSVISFTAPVAWTAEVINTRADAWCKVEPTSGAAGSANITVTTTPNDTHDDRMASVVIKAGTVSKTISVSQKQKDALTITASKFEVGKDGGEVAIEVKSNIEYSYTVDDVAKEWITYKSTRAMQSSTLVFDVAKNESVKKREGKVIISSGDFKETVTIYQEGEAPSIVLNKNVFNIPSAKSTIAVEVKSNVDVEVELPTDAEWIVENTTRAMSTNTYYFDIKQNDGYDSREAKIKFTNKENNISEVVSVKQMQRDAIVVADAEYEFDTEGGALDFDIQTNVDIAVAISDNAKEWIKQVSTRALETKSLHFDIVAYEGEEDREGTITITGGNATQVIKVKQRANVEINPNDVPDNEIWYTTTDNSLFGDWSYYKEVCGDPFDKEIISHTYANGIGKIIFDGPLTIINDNAFSSYGNYTLAPKELTSIYLPNSVEYIGSGAFGNQKGIQTFMVPNSIIEIEGGAFMSTKIIEFIGENTLPNGEGILVDGVLYALSYDENKEELIIPSGVKEIGQSLMSTGLQDFCVRPNLKRLVISEGVEVINDNAFQYCLNLESVTLPSSLTEVGSYIFYNCSNIKEYSGNSKYTTADNKCFLDIIYVDGQVRYGIQSAVKVGLPNDYIIPEGIVTIRPRAFEGTDNLRSITLPNSIMIIESSGEIFRNCPNFEFIYGKYASSDNKAAIIHNCLFCGNTNAMLAFAGKGIKEYSTSDEVNWLGDMLFAYQNDLENVVIDDNVQYIGNYCFSYSPNLKSITLPANLEVVRYDPFIGSNNLETIYFRSPIPPKFEIGGIEQSQYPNLTIYVPEPSLQTYMNDANWGPLQKYMKGYQYDDLYYISTDYSADGKVTTLQTATKGDGIDIVLMGDAYSDRQIADGTYERDMLNIYSNLFTEEPYKSFKNLFNVYYVNVVSENEGYATNYETALDGYFGEGTRVGGDDRMVFNYALKAISVEEMDEAILIVAMNSDNYAGTCYMYPAEINNTDYGSGPSIAYFPRGGNDETFAQLLHHEACGHGFSKLADEYAYENMGAVPSDYVSQIQSQQANWGWWKNIDFTSDLSVIRWKHFINDTRYAYDGLGAYQGGLTYWTGVWRSTENSIMRYNKGGFNAPSREAIYYRIHKLAYGTDWVYNYEEFVEWDARNRKVAAAVSVPYRREMPKEYKPTHPPVVINKSWRDAK